MGVRIAKFEVFSFEGDHKEVRARWRNLAGSCRQITNRVWREWSNWHHCHGTEEVIEAYRAAWVKHHREGGPKPGKFELKAVTPELSKHIASVLAKKYPDVNERVRSLVMQATLRLVRSTKALKGKFPGWWDFFTDVRSVPSRMRDAQIPFDVRNSTIVGPTDDGEPYRLLLRLDRVTRDGMTATSHRDVVRLKAKKQGVEFYDRLLARITAGELPYKGSSVYYDEKNRKWFALIAYEVSSRPSVEPTGRTAYLHPMRDAPWALWIDGQPMTLGDARTFSAMRRKLARGLIIDSEAARSRSSSRTGHGRGLLPNIAKRARLKWRMFVKSANHLITRQAVRLCAERGVDRIIYLQPAAGDKRDHRATRFLSMQKDGREPVGWDWFQVAAMLGYKASEAGIAVEVRK